MNDEDPISRIRKLVILILQVTGSFAATVLLSILAVLLMLATITAIAVSTGDIRSICIAGLIWFAVGFSVLISVYSTKQTFDQAQILINSLGIVSQKLFAGDAGAVIGYVFVSIELVMVLASQCCFTIMGVIASGMELSTTVHIRYAEACLHLPQHVSGISNGWQVAFLLVPPALGAIADKTKHTRENPGKAGDLVMIFTGFQFVRSMYLLVLGLQGSAVFCAGKALFSISQKDVSPFTVARQNAALALHSSLGNNLFFWMFALIPAVWLLSCLFRKVKHPAFVLGSRTSVTALWLLVFSGSVIAHQRFDDPIDARLSICAGNLSGQPDSAQLPCYKIASNEWENERREDSLLIQKELAGQTKQRSRFLSESLAWDNKLQNTLAGVEKPLRKNTDKDLISTKTRLELVRERVKDLRTTQSNLEIYSLRQRNYPTRLNASTRRSPLHKRGT